MSFALWTEKYRPATFDDFAFNKEVVPLIEELTKSDDFPHVLFYGPNGGGKHTFIKATLRALFGESADKMKSEIKEFKATKSTSVDCVINSSNHHTEVTPSDSERHDKVIVNTLIKDIASARSIDSGANSKPFKVVVIHEVDRLSKDAQAGLRRTMEKYMSNCRIIFNCSSLSKVIAPLKSRCVQIRVPAPSEENIVGVLKHIATEEGVKMPDVVADRFAEASNRNLRRAIMML